MIIETRDGHIIDTDSLTPEERHVLQKLFAWSTLVDSVDQFHDKKKQALAAGWNQSGPIRESRALSRVIQHLEIRVRDRLKNQPAR
jgi:hypothetical protein